MPLVQSVDGPNRRILLGPDSVGVDVHPIDIYKEVRALRRSDESLRRFNLFMRGEGNVQKTPTTFTERYVVCLEGTRIVPYDIDHTLTITGTIITDEGTGGIQCFDRTLLSVSTVVDIDYQPPQVEVIQATLADGISAEDISAIATAVADEIDIPEGEYPTTNEIADAVRARLLSTVSFPT